MKTHGIRGACKASLVERDGRLEVDSPASQFVSGMVAEHDMDALLILASNALARDPCCIEAHLALAGFAETRQGRLDHLKVAVMAGGHLWDPVAAREGTQPDCLRHPAMVPYAHAMAGFGEALLEDGNVHAARFCFQRHAEMTSPEVPATSSVSAPARAYAS